MPMRMENICPICEEWKGAEYEECFECAKQKAQEEGRLCDCGKFKQAEYDQCYECAQDS